jgi:anaerobic dimethyl sulfoxide reductase subunit B (iron-sulfur subunit)
MGSLQCGSMLPPFIGKRFANLAVAGRTDLAMEPLIVFNSRTCISCHSCEIGCQLENDAPPGVLLRRVKTHVLGKFPASSLRSISTACFHCGDPTCVSACPAGALRRRANGIVEHFRARCIGCGYCIQTCPFHVPQFSAAQRTMRKCSFCVQRLELGRKPACVAKCTTGALIFHPDGRNADLSSAYGKNERLHMVYRVEGKPADYSLPEPVPLNTVTSHQISKWLTGLIPGGFLLAWLLRSTEDHEKSDE